MTYNIHKGKYYYEFQNTIRKLKKECFICGTKENIEPHHIKRVKAGKQEYKNPENIVMLCRKHHKRYHNKYKKTNQKTFAEYCLKQKNKEINKQQKKIGELEAEVRILKKRK